MTDYVVIETDEDFVDACRILSGGSGPVAVDVERASGFRYSQRAYLVQVFRRDAGAFLFDPITITSFAPLQEAIGAEEWVFHAASQDLPSLHELGLEPASVFDTELAARLLGYERVGLAAVVERALGIVLAKEHSAADWSTRPLPNSWLEYAELDVLHLVDVRDFIAAELERLGQDRVRGGGVRGGQDAPAQAAARGAVATAERAAPGARREEPRRGPRAVAGA